MDPTVSICIPTYNRKEYLKEALDSIFSQTYKDYEVIVVDDGSTDGTDEMIKSSRLPIRYYWQENSGESPARNKLVGLAHGRFITFLDSDDLLMPDALERMVKVMDAESGQVVVYGPYLRIDRNGNVNGRCKRELHSGFVTNYLFQDIFIHSCGSMFSKNALQESGGFDESFPVSADYDLWLRLSLKHRFIALPQPTFKRRRHPTNISTTCSKNQIVELHILERFYYQKGGDEVIPKKTAMRRLSREEYRVGKYALKEKKLDLALRYFRASFRRRPNIKALIFCAGLLIAK